MTTSKVNHFAVLGLQPGVSEDEIKKTYKSMAKIYHPDKNGDKRAEEKFKNITNSYEFLKSKDRREMHERELINMDKENRKGKETHVYDERPRNPKEKRREHRKEYDKRKQDEHYSDYTSSFSSEYPFGPFKSYDEEFNSFFSARDPLREMKDPQQYIEEFMRPFKFGNIEQIMSDFRPFASEEVGQRRGRKPRHVNTDLEQRNRNKNGREIRFKAPSAEFTSFYEGDDAFSDL